MTENHLHKIQQDPKYQILIRECSDKAAQGLLTLLVTINVGAFVTTVELLEDHYWLLVFFTVSTIAAILSRTGLFYIYRNEVTMFEHANDVEALKPFDKSRMKWWKFTEVSAWLSLISFIIGVVALAAFFIGRS